MTYEQAVTSRVGFRAALNELAAHGLYRCEFAQCEDTGNIVEKATGETVAKLRKGGYSGRELLGWLGY